jgi:hypothetical protein
VPEHIECFRIHIEEMWVVGILVIIFGYSMYFHGVYGSMIFPV